ncbi:MAG TPA: ADP-ribose pyrophosphatase [Holosporales bacterium]|nr:ADP-ribose pyrophosphatase [Holosporales bacterium]
MSAPNNRVNVGIGVLILNTKNELLLGKRKAAHGDGTWGPPGGKLDFGEDFKECMVREVKEEVGINLEREDPRIIDVQNDIFPQEGKHFVSLIAHVALTKDQEAQLVEPHKCAEWKWFRENDLPNPLFQPVEKFFSHKSLWNVAKR